MTDKPINITAEDVRAVLREIEATGTGKSQFRKVIKPRDQFSIFAGNWTDDYVMHPENESWRQKDMPYSPGDRLWCKERAIVYQDGEDRKCIYVADLPPEETKASPLDKYMGVCWKSLSSARMPRWASRLTLVVESVVPQRLQDITEDDARAEGFEDGLDGAYHPGPTSDFSDHWTDRNLKHPFESNPWVWRVTFQPHLRNIDQMED